MASLPNKIRQYAKANSVHEVDFLTDVRLQDDSNGQGPYIKEWNLDIAKPTQAQLDAFRSTSNKLMKIMKRLKQLEKLYTDPGTSSLKKFTIMV
jgi:hypothetical protein